MFSILRFVTVLGFFLIGGLFVESTMHGDPGEKKVVDEGKVIEQKIRSLSTDVLKKKKDERLLLYTLLLQQNKFDQVEDLCEKETDKEYLFFQMVRVQAFIGDGKFSAAAAQLGKIDGEQRSRDAQIWVYRALAFKRTELEIAWTTLLDAAKLDVANPLPYFHLCKLASTDEKAIEFGAKTLALVQPDTEIAKETRQIIIKYLK